MRIDRRLKDIVTFLYREENGEYLPIGTAFHVLIVQGGAGFNHVVTCKHVVRPVLEDHQPVYARLHRSDRLGVEYRPLEDSWTYHDDESVDLAVLPTRPTGEPISLAAIGEGELLTRETLQKGGQLLCEGDDVFFIGLFEPFTGQDRNLPIVRFGKIAMLTDQPLQGEYGLAECYLLECQAFPFNSGSPVFCTVLENGLIVHKLLAVIVGYFPKEQRVHLGAQGLSVFAHVGISTAVPVDKLHEILHGERLVEARQDKSWAGHIEERRRTH